MPNQASNEAVRGQASSSRSGQKRDRDRPVDDVESGAKRPRAGPSASNEAPEPANETTDGVPAKVGKVGRPRKTTTAVVTDVEAMEIAEVRQLNEDEREEAYSVPWEKHWAKGREAFGSSVIKQDELKELTQYRRPRGWTEEAEESLMEDWEASAEKRALDGLSQSGLNCLTALYKVSFHTCRCSPVDVINPSMGLYYDGSSHVARGSDGVTWSHGFCKSLERLLTHPFWRGEAYCLAYFILFAVVCRTDDRRGMRRPDKFYPCSVMGELALRTTGDFDVNVHDVHTRLREELKQAGQMLSTHSDVLFELGKLVRSKAHGTPDPSGRYGVRIDDLNNILETLDSFRGGGLLPFMVPSAQIHTAYLALREQTAPERRQVVELHARAWLHQLRHQRRYNPLRPLAVEVDDQEGDAVVNDDGDAFGGGRPASSGENTLVAESSGLGVTKPHGAEAVEPHNQWDDDESFRGFSDEEGGGLGDLPLPQDSDAAGAQASPKAGEGVSSQIDESTSQLKEHVPTSRIVLRGLTRVPAGWIIGSKHRLTRGHHCFGAATN